MDRLISVSAAKSYIEVTVGDQILKGCMNNVLDAVPAVDAVPVVHGRWIAVPSSDMMTGKAYKCSECQKMRYGSFMPNYCQNCGAKMDLEVAENG